MKLKTYFDHERNFKKYVKSFYSVDSHIQTNILLKEYHTLRVVENAEIIATQEFSDPHSVFLAKIIALYHDVGRFEQFRVYKTFNDRESCNHADLSIEIIQKKEFLVELSAEEQSIIIESIKHHNKLALPNIHENWIIYGQLIRDADKLDIWGVVIEGYRNPTSNFSILTLGLKNSIQYNPLIVENLRKHETINIFSVNTVTDLKLLQLGWIFDLNFSTAFKLVKERKILEQMAGTLPHEPDLVEIVNHLKEFIEKKQKMVNHGLPTISY